MLYYNQQRAYYYSCSLIFYTKRKFKSRGRGIKLKNLDIRRAAAANGVKLWRIADELGIADTTFCRKLRKELPQEEKRRIFAIIEKLSQEAS